MGAAASGRIIGAFLTQGLAGRAAAVWAPEVVPSRRAATAAGLVRSPWPSSERAGSASSRRCSMNPPVAGVPDLTRGGMPDHRAALPRA